MEQVASFGPFAQHWSSARRQRSTSAPTPPWLPAAASPARQGFRDEPRLWQRFVVLGHDQLSQFNWNMMQTTAEQNSDSNTPLGAQSAGPAGCPSPSPCPAPAYAPASQPWAVAPASAQPQSGFQPHPVAMRWDPTAAQHGWAPGRAPRVCHRLRLRPHTPSCRDLRAQRTGACP